jgi:hypothetical protein
MTRYVSAATVRKCLLIDISDAYQVLSELTTGIDGGLSGPEGSISAAVRDAFSAYVHDLEEQYRALTKEDAPSIVEYCEQRNVNIIPLLLRRMRRDVKATSQV